MWLDKKFPEDHLHSEHGQWSQSFAGGLAEAETNCNRWGSGAQKCMPPERLRCANSSLLIHSPAKYLLRARMVRGQPCPCRAYTAVQNDTQNEGTTTHAMKKHKAGAAADNAAGSFLRASEENSALMSEQRPAARVRALQPPWEEPSRQAQPQGGRPWPGNWPRERGTRRRPEWENSDRREEWEQMGRGQPHRAPEA